jgi:type II secretory pathway component PulF
MKYIGLKKESEFLRRFSYLLSSGQGIIESLSLLSSSYLFLSDISEGIKSGKSLKNCFQNKNYLSPITMKVVEIGELTGTLAKSLSDLSKHLRNKYEQRNQIISLCIYPFSVMIIAMLLIIFLMTYILPQILPIFKDLKIQLPLTTRLLIDGIYFLNTYGTYIIGFLIISLIILFIYQKKQKVSLKNTITIVIRRIPYIKKISQKIFSIYFFKSLGIMLAAKVGILQALHVIYETNDIHKVVIFNLISHVQSGKTISSFVSSRADVFEESVAHFLIIGERTGSLSNTCIYLSEYLDHDLQNLFKRSSKLLEPLLIIMIGFVVGFISISLIYPLYEITRFSSF